MKPKPKENTSKGKAIRGKNNSIENLLITNKDLH